MYFAKSLLLLINFLVLIEIVVTQENEFAPNIMTMIEEIGFGAKGVTHYFKKLVQGCDNVGNLNDWIVLMESYLSCEDTVWPYKSDEEKLLKTNLELIEDFCNAWPKRWKCSVPLAQSLDICYGPGIESGKRGSNGLKFSDSFARFICKDKNQYLEHVDKSDLGKYVPADRKSLRCVADNQEKIAKCVKQEQSLLLLTNICSKIKVIQDCTVTTMERYCHRQDTEWSNKLIKQIKDDFRC